MKTVFKHLTILWMALMSVQVSAEQIYLDDMTKIFAIAAHKDASKLYLATQTGVYTTNGSNSVEMVWHDGANLVSFAVAADDNNTLYVSGHPPMGGNLGLLRSADSALTWDRIDVSLDGPAGYRNLVVSYSDPNIIYAIYQGLQVSQDGGIHWLKVAREPPGLFALAVSAQNPKRLYAANRSGLYVSRDGGRSWHDPYQFNLPVTMVQAMSDGTLYAFVVSRGLLRMDESGGQWSPVNNEFGSQLLQQMIESPEGSARLVALTQASKVLVSGDLGKSWQRLSRNRKPVTESVRRGKELFTSYCQSCHGVEGVGESYTLQTLTDRDYLMAPALDDSSHAWHHTDENLVQTILQGSQRTDRMAAFSGSLTEADAVAVVAYMKSLWSRRALDCQGPRHMQCM